MRRELRRVPICALATVLLGTAFLLAARVLAPSWCSPAITGGTGTAEPTILVPRGSTAEYNFLFEIV